MCSPVDFVLLGFSNKFDVRGPRNCLQFCLTGGILDPFSTLCEVLSVSIGVTSLLPLEGAALTKHQGSSLFSTEIVNLRL